MGANRYAISLRIWHPLIDPRDITAGINIQPRRSWKAGEPRKTPAGKLLPGINRETYWSAQLRDGEAQPGDIESDVLAMLEALSPCGEFLRKLRSDGGRAELFVGWFTETHSGWTAGQPILGKMASLGIDLSFDIYVPDQEPADEEI